MATEYVTRLEDEGSTKLDLVGGKGASLGKLSRAGFRVPPGFCVTTQAYHAFRQSSGLDGVLKDLVTGIDFGDAERLDEVAGNLRAQILGAEMAPDVAEQIAAGYAALGGDVYVAVRSSGTAEDLAEASFAGQHDTYLDVVGEADVLDAVKRCWASLWTARATAYRQTKGFEHLEVGISVVVQTMVPSEVSGVLFTGNPRNTATDEMVVNASWGLGEAIVSGSTQPDEFTLRWSDLGTREQTLGSKQVQVVRNPETGKGTVQADVPAGDQQRFCLTPEQTRELGHLGRRVTEFYGGIPQDIEFGFAGGTLYLLQSRPITGVAFSWDADLEAEAWQTFPEAEGSVWTRALTDEAWTGACTPLFYSIRGRLWAKGDEDAMRMWGLPEGLGFQYWKYHKGTPYYNTKVWEVILENAYPQQLRPMLVQNLDPRRQDAVLNKPFRPMALAKIIGRVYALDRENQGFLNFFKRFDSFLYGELGARADGLPDEELRALSDIELVRHAEECVEFEAGYPASMWAPIQIYIPMALTGLTWMAQNWYTGSNKSLAVDLMTGTRERTATATENLGLWELSLLISRSPTLRAAFGRCAGGNFESEFSSTEEGRAWLERYILFRDANRHRGHSDRDIYHPRRCEDPSLDYNAIKAFLSADDSFDPVAAEDAANARRKAAYLDAIENIRQGPLGAAKVEAFKIVFEFVSRFLVVRDNERYWLDKSTYTIKRTYLEIGRRLVERGEVETDRDFYFLGREELYDLFQGRANMTLTRAKIAARMRNFDAVNDKTISPAAFLEGYAPADLTDAHDDAAGVLRGTGTSGGRVTGTARVVKALADIGTVRSGEILVCNATDPGWTPVFIVIKGIVVETGGVLAHAACLAREYGFPAVQLSSAMQRIPDGATITVDGDFGTVTLEDAAEETEEA